ncbi:MAG: NlpC/P60 family protein [Propionibacteriaceae bacterium]|nr:NlpC/P60 family protein [Propionibacteriaceae bacterium]
MNRLRGVIAVAVSTLCIASFVVPAHADPEAVAKAKADLERIQQESSAIDHDIIEASARAGDAQIKLEEVTADLRTQEAKVSAMSSDLGEIAVVQLQSGGFDITAQLLTSESESSFLSSLATIQNEANRSNSNLQLLQVEQAGVDALRAEADRTSAQLKTDLAAKEELAQQFDAKEAEAEAVFNRLSEEERERLHQLELQRIREQEEADRQARLAAEREAAAREEAAAAATSNSEAPSSERSTTPASTAPSSEAAAPAASTSGSSSRIQTAISAATSKVGSTYVWGTSGPSTFDCSGLTSYAYRQVGISLPRSSRAQLNAGTSVAKSDLQPGDLVFYYSPVSHVGMYIGNGKIVDAANPRSGVRITSLNSMPFAGARRVG